MTRAVFVTRDPLWPQRVEAEDFGGGDGVGDDDVGVTAAQGGTQSRGFGDAAGDGDDTRDVAQLLGVEADAAEAGRDVENVAVAVDGTGQDVADGAGLLEFGQFGAAEVAGASCRLANWGVMAPMPMRATSARRRQVQGIDHGWFAEQDACCGFVFDEERGQEVTIGSVQPVGQPARQLGAVNQGIAMADGTDDLDYGRAGQAPGGHGTHDGMYAGTPADADDDAVMEGFLQGLCAQFTQTANEDAVVFGWLSEDNGLFEPKAFTHPAAEVRVGLQGVDHADFDEAGKARFVQQARDQGARAVDPAGDGFLVQAVFVVPGGDFGQVVQAFGIDGARSGAPFRNMLVQVGANKAIVAANGKPGGDLPNRPTKPLAHLRPAVLVVFCLTPHTRNVPS